MSIKLFRKYFTNSFFLNAPLAINTLITFIALPIVLKSLPIADYGKWQFIFAIQAWLVVFSGTNITSASKKGIAKGLNGTFLYAFLQRLKILFFLVIFVIGLAFYFKVTGKNIFSTLLIIVGFYLFFGYLFQVSFYEFLIAKKKFKQWAFWQILVSLVSTIGSAIIAFLTKSIVYFALFQLGSISVLSWIAWLLLIKKEKLIQSYRKGEIDKECVSYGLKLIPVDLVSITAGKISHFIIGPFFGFTNLAVFSIANKLRDKVAGIIKSARPLLYADFAKKERKELIEMINHYLVKLGFLGIILTLAFIAFGWLYIDFFLPFSYHSAIIYFIILTLGLPAGLMAIILHTVLESHLRYKELAAIGVISNILKLLLILIFGYFWKIIGVCIVLAVSGWISFGFYYLLTLKREFVVSLIHRYSWLEKLVEKY